MSVRFGNVMGSRGSVIAARYSRLRTAIGRSSTAIPAHLGLSRLSRKLRKAAAASGESSAALVAAFHADSVSLMSR
jgi:hypothetical protein